MKHKITDRQLIALLASWHGQRPQDIPCGLYGEMHEKAGQPFWRAKTSMGGATHRMIEDLRDRGFFTRYNRYEDFGDKTSGDLTVIGYEAIAERLREHKLPKMENAYGDTIFDFNETITLRDVRDRQERRMEQEATQASLREKAQEQARQRAEMNHSLAREQKLTKLRAALKEYGIGDNWSDVQLLNFHERIASL